MNTLQVNADQGRATINKNIYGHFAEHLGKGIYEGCWVGEDSSIPNTRGIRNDVVEALRLLKPPILRWPGGCFADEYHWRDGIGRRDHRPAMINTHWGGVSESNHFGTHEFFDLCEQVGTEPYICGNVGSGTVAEMQSWVEYMTSDASSPMADLRRANGREEPWKLRYFGVGNENWGCGGNMRPEYYADLYRQYATYVRNLSGNTIYKIACGPNGGDYEWTEVLMKRAGGFMDGLSFHYYTMAGDWNKKGSALDFDENGWFLGLRACLKIDEMLRRHSAIMERFDPEKRVGLIVDEWGTWWDVEPGTNPGFLYQQNTMRDALVAGVSLNIFNAHCERVRMANIAQTVNVLQAMILTDGDRMILTPTYHVFEMFAPHQNATMLPLELQTESYSWQDETIPALSASASRRPSGPIFLSLCHANPNRNTELTIQLRGVDAKNVSGRVLSGDATNAHSTFENPTRVQPQAFNGARLESGALTVSMPPASIVTLEVGC